MKYYIFIDGKQSKIMDTYPQRGIKESWNIVPVPDTKDIDIGFKILNKDGSLYGTIVSINECFYHFIKPNKPDYDGIFQIESLPKLFINGTFLLETENKESFENKDNLVVDESIKDQVYQEGINPEIKKKRTKKDGV